jgi:hypothetical protein
VCENEQVAFRGSFSSTIRHAERCVCMRDTAPRRASYRRKFALRIVRVYSYATFRRVAFPLAPLGAIASLSSERNGVNKSSALTMMTGGMTDAICG